MTDDQKCWIPARAWQAAVAANGEALDNPRPGVDAGRAALAAAAPLIVAAELRQLIAELMPPARMEYYDQTEEDVREAVRSVCLHLDARATELERRLPGVAVVTEDLKAENAQLREALDLLRPAHHTPYADEEHQGGDCTDVILQLISRAFRYEGPVQKLHAWCDSATDMQCSHTTEDECRRCDVIKDCALAVRALLPAADAKT
jgi:hypothetical protein